MTKTPRKRTAENKACNPAPVGVMPTDTNATTSQEDQTMDTPTTDTDARAALDAGIATQKANVATLKSHKANHKAATAYTKQAAKDIPAATDENADAVASATEAHATAVTAEAAWKAAVDTIAAAVAADKDAVKALRGALTASNKAPKSTKVATATQNGYTLPQPGSKNAAAFTAIDDVKAAIGRDPKMAEVLPLAEHRGLALGNVRGKFNRWRQFHGVAPTGRATIEDLVALAGHFPEVPGYAAAVTKAQAEAADAAAKAAKDADAAKVKADAKAADDAAKAAAKAAA